MADSVDEKTLEQLVKYYESSAEATQESRAKSERDRDYYDHKQLSESVLAELEKRKQPPTVINYVQKNVNFLLGIERQNRTDPKAYPRTPAHEEAAHAASDSIKYVCDKTSFDILSSDAYENLLIEGVCGSVIEAKPDRKGGFEIDISRISWDRCFWDPHSREKDFSDANYKGYIRWMDLSEAEDMGKKYGYDGDFTEEHSYFGETYDDKPSYQLWYDQSRRRVKISYIWYLEKGVWHHAIYTKAGIIWGPKPSPYLDEGGEPECNFIMGSSLVDRENCRYGYVRSMISQQDAINKRESKSIHLLSQRQTWATDGTFKNVNKAKTELAKPDGHVEINPGKRMGEDFGVFDTGDMALGQFQLLQEAKRDINTVVASGSAAGASSSASGRAIDARAEMDNIEITPFTDAHKQWKIKNYRCIWNKVRQFWPEEKWIRVTDDEKNLKWVGLNQPVTVAEQMIAQNTGEDITEIKKKYSQEIQQAILMRPELGQLAEVRNQVAELDVDIILDEIPNIINFQNEQFMMIAKLAERRGDIPTNLLIKMSSIRNKDQILDEMEGDDNQKAAQAQIAQAQQETQMRQVNAEAANKEADAVKKQAEVAKIEADTTKTSIESELMLLQQENAQVII